MMRLRQDRSWLLFLSALGALLPGISIAQSRTPASATYSPASKSSLKPLAPRLLTADEGLTVLGAALESRAHTETENDCSHLVHAIYERAGFPYSYASSSSLYAGTEQFRRVSRPQPGDLVVWPGHVGIAVSLAQHTFYSALRSGHGVEPYDTAYWKEHGRPRFLRYVTDTPAARPASSSSREASLKTANSETLRPESRNVSFATTEGSPAQADPTPSIISGATIHSQRPTPDEVTAALEQLLSETGDGFHGLDMLNPSKPLIVFDQVSVERVRLQRNRGWAEVRIAGALKLSQQKTNSTKHNESHRWQLVRSDHDRWEITIPSEAIYLPSDIAVRTLAHQLSALADETAAGPGAAEEKLQLSRLLNLTLAKPPSTRR